MENEKFMYQIFFIFMFLLFLICICCIFITLNYYNEKQYYKNQFLNVCEIVYDQRDIIFELKPDLKNVIADLNCSNLLIKKIWS